LLWRLLLLHMPQCKPVCLLTTTANSAKTDSPVSVLFF
jgi:hypothetical protein